MKKFQVAIVDVSSIVQARGVGKQLAREIGLNLADQTRVATAISEITRNVIQYAGRGRCEVSDESTPAEMRVRVFIEDQGPGISDVPLAMRDGYSTGRGLGSGLPGAKRLMSEFNVQSRPGLTRVSMVLSRKRIATSDLKA